MALCVARHGAREDYECTKRGENWQLTSDAKTRGGWDPPLTAEGRLQGSALGAGLKQHLERLGLPPVSRIFSSPLTRCLQTSAAAATALGVKTIAVEPGLAEGMLEDWYRSWAIPGSDSTWGGPAHARTGTVLPPGTPLHPAALQPAVKLLHGPVEARAALRDHDVCNVTIDTCHTPVTAPPTYQWGSFESESALGDRMEITLTALKARYPDQTILALSHGGPCGHTYQRLMRSDAPKVAGYTSLYVYVPSPDGTWDCPIAADRGHLLSDSTSGLDVPR